MDRLPPCLFPKDLKDIPAIISRQLEIHPVEEMDEVLSEALIFKEGEPLFNGGRQPFEPDGEIVK